mmetsp:Transcript_1306/g.2156  ORF Transcript_1306/g.2156 Transcript_1306/m.2156 type:complete len:438 (+) Transcript_1306:236-1549(+)
MASPLGFVASPVGCTSLYRKTSIASKNSLSTARIATTTGPITKRVHVITCGLLNNDTSSQPVANVFTTPVSPHTARRVTPAVASQVVQAAYLQTSIGGGIGNDNKNPNNGNNNNGNNNNGDDSNDGEPEDFIVPSNIASTMAAMTAIRGKTLITTIGGVLLFAAGGFIVAENMASLMTSVSENDALIDSEKPVVVLLSWMGARKKHLDRFANHYREMGYDVVMYFNSMGTALVPSMSEEQAARVLKFIQKQPEGRPVIVHAFSIGTGIYGLLLNRVQQDVKTLEKLKNNIVGVIFDSGPAMIFPHDVAKGLHTVCPSLSRNFWRAVAGSLFYVTKARESFGMAENALAKFQFPAPQLYLYSKDDLVVSNLQESVSHFIENNTKRGVEIQRKVWEKSRHAAHFVLHPDEYIENLNQFLENCMQRRNSGITSVLLAPTN